MYQVLQDLREPMEPEALQVHKAHLALQDRWAHLAHKAHLALQDRWVLKAMKVEICN
jgi:hypothetical protein